MLEHGVSNAQTRADLIAELGARYLWWERDRIAEVSPRRIVAQIMDIGDYDDLRRIERVLGREPLCDALANALPGWFRPRSWSYWHLRLHLREPGEASPAMPARTFS